MSVYASSSRTSMRTNPDGTWNVTCSECGDFIAKTTLPIRKSICALCQRALDGEKLDKQSLQDYMLSKQKNVDVSLLLLPQEEAPTARGFSLRSMAGEFMEALGIKKGPAEPPKSAKIARQKRRPPLFSGVELGSIEEVDRKLQEPK